MARQQNNVLSLEQAFERGQNWWFRSPERSAQHWYITFCLLMSATQDRLTGITLMHQRNLNWAVTAFYYSMVHSARLLFFLKYGDFPTKHADMQQVFGSQGDNARKIQFNWIKNFYDNIAEQNKPYLVSVTISDIRRDLDLRHAIGSSLSALGKLRNDANYESLLIAHEKNHRYVPERFQKLACLSQSASASAVEHAIRQYSLAINEGLWKHWNVPLIKWESNEYVRRRLLADLSDKFSGLEEAYNILQHLKDVLIFEIDTNTDQETSDSFEKAILMEFFEGKTSLMESFNDKIEQLEHPNE